MRTDKGLSHFVSAMEQNKHKVDFVVQAFMPETLAEPEAPDLIRRLKRMPSCKLYEGELSMDDYRTLLGKIDIAVLPYRPGDFRYRTSNIFAEAVGLAKVVITPKETFMGKTADDLGIGVTYSPYSPEALSEAMEEAVMRFEELHARAQEVAMKWREGNSADEFVKRIIEIAS